MEQKKKYSSYESLISKYYAVLGDLPFGIECEIGWYSLIEEITQRLIKIAQNEGIHWKAVQIKEKFGTLQYYISNGTDKMLNEIQEIIATSRFKCEICAEPGELSFKNHWYKTRCGACMEKEEKLKPFFS